MTLSRSAWAVVSLLWVVALLNYLDRQLVTTMSAPIKVDLGISDGAFGLLPSVFLWVYGILSPIAGYAADRFPRGRIICASLLVWSACTFATGHVHSFPQMLVARALMGVSEAFYIPAALALIVEYHRGPTRALATGLHLSGAYAGSVLGGLGGWLADAGGWRFAFTLFGAIGVGYALVLLLFLRDKIAVSDSGETESPSLPIRPGAALKSLLSTRNFRILLAMEALAGAASWTTRNWLPTFLHSELHVTVAQAGIVGASFLNAAAFAGMLVAGLVSDRWSRTTPLARTLVPAIAFCLAAPWLFTVGIAHSVAVVAVALSFVGAAQGALDANLMPAVCVVAGDRLRATGYGLLNFISTMTGGLMTCASGLMKDAGVPFAVTFQIAGGLLLAASLLLFTIKTTKS